MIALVILAVKLKRNTISACIFRDTWESGLVLKNPTTLVVGVCQYDNIKILTRTEETLYQYNIEIGLTCTHLDAVVNDYVGNLGSETQEEYH